MDRNTPRISHSHCTDYMGRGINKFDTYSECRDEENREASVVSLDSILPDDLLERVLAYLPVASIFRAGCVCKRWHEIVSSSMFRWKSTALPQKPWYFMFTSSDEPTGHAYDPTLRKWHHIELPGIETPNCSITSAGGLVAFMDSDIRGKLYVMNPLRKNWKELEEPPALKDSDYSTVALSVNSTKQGYHISIINSKEVDEKFFQWGLSIHLYDSEAMTWVTSLQEVLEGWRSGAESVICDGVLYFLIYASGRGLLENRHALLTYNLSRQPTCGLLKSLIQVPSPLTSGRLMNLKEKLVLVGGIGKTDRPDIIKGIGIWVLNGRAWQEIVHMPHKLFQGFGEFDDVFASSGTDDLIYIKSYGSPALLTFDMSRRQWKWAPRCPVAKRFSHQLFTGFCFEPRLEIVP